MKSAAVRARALLLLAAFITCCHCQLSDSLADSLGENEDDFAFAGAATAPQSRSAAEFAAAPAFVEAMALDPQLLVALRQQAQQLGASVRVSISGDGAASGRLLSP